MDHFARVHSHWHLLVDGLQASSLSFYQAVSDALMRRAVPDIRVGRVDWHEGGILSAKREYLRVSRGKLYFDVCAAPFGRSFFFSWWLSEAAPSYVGLCFAAGVFILGMVFVVCSGIFGPVKGLLLAFAICTVGLWALAWATRKHLIDLEETVLAMPIIGRLYEWLFQPETFYKRDTVAMFRESVRQAVLEVVDDLVKQQGLRALSDNERESRLKDWTR